jgi:RNA polymerase sigma-70 factor (ECF subfamily)
MDSPRSEEARWFSQEVLPHDGQLKAYLRGSFPAVRDVDDVVQESLLRIWRVRLEKPIRSGRSFLFQVARRIAIDVVRRQRSGPFVAIDLATAESVPCAAPGNDEAAARQDDLALLTRAFEDMPPRRREVMLLRKIEGVSQKEIASRLGITEAAVQIHVVRGLRGLERFFEARGAGPLSR